MRRKSTRSIPDLLLQRRPSMSASAKELWRRSHKSHRHSTESAEPGTDTAATLSSCCRRGAITSFHITALASSSVLVVFFAVPRSVLCPGLPSVGPTSESSPVCFILLSLAALRGPGLGGPLRTLVWSELGSLWAEGCFCPRPGFNFCFTSVFPSTGGNVVRDPTRRSRARAPANTLFVSSGSVGGLGKAFNGSSSSQWTGNFGL